MPDSTVATNSPSMELPLFPLHPSLTHPSRISLFHSNSTRAFDHADSQRSWPLHLRHSCTDLYNRCTLTLLLNFFVKQVSLADKLASSFLGTLLSTSGRELDTVPISCLKVWVKRKEEWRKGGLTDREGMNLTGCPEVIRRINYVREPEERAYFPKA